MEGMPCSSAAESPHGAGQRGIGEPPAAGWSRAEPQPPPGWLRRGKQRAAGGGQGRGLGPFPAKGGISPKGAARGLVLLPRSGLALSLLLTLERADPCRLLLSSN